MALFHDLRQGLAFEMALPRSTGENSSGCSRLTDATTDESETNRLRCGRNKHILETKTVARDRCSPWASCIRITSESRNTAYREREAEKARWRDMAQRWSRSCRGSPSERRRGGLTSSEAQNEGVPLEGLSSVSWAKRSRGGGPGTRGGPGSRGGLAATSFRKMPWMSHSPRGQSLTASSC